MEQNATWGSEVEIFAASMLLNINIFVYTKSGDHWRWLKHSPPNVRIDSGIYLYHKSGNHYEVVLAVENSQIPINICEDQYYFPVKQNIENCKKRKQSSAQSTVNKKYKSDANICNLAKKKAVQKSYKSSQTVREKVQHNYWRNRYSTDMSYRNKKKEMAKERYQRDHLHRNKKKTASCLKYYCNSLLRSRVKQYSRLKYSTNLTFQANVKSLSKKKYAVNPTFKENVKRLSKQKYANNPTFKENVKSFSKKKYAVNPTFKENVKSFSKQKYATDTNFRSNLKEKSIQKYATNAAFRKRVKTSFNLKYATNSDFKENKVKKSKEKYATNFLFRSRVIEKNRLKYRQFSSFRNKMKASSIMKYKGSPLFRHTLKQYLKNKYHLNPSIRQTKKDRMKASRTKITFAIKTFKRSIADTPKYVCKICIRLLYKKQVKKFKEKRYIDKCTCKLNEMTERCCAAANLHECDDTCTDNCWMFLLKSNDGWICHTCDRYLHKDRMPPQAIANNLFLVKIPHELRRLNVLERQLVSLRIPFMKLLSLPRGGQKGVKGPVVNVPSDITSVTTALPRNISDAQLIKVKLKRKMSYKGHYTFKWINPDHVTEAIKYLKANNKWYEDVTIHESWLSENNEDDLIAQENKSSGDQSDEEDKSNARENEDIVSKDQDNEDNGSSEGLPVESCLEPTDIGQEVLDTNSTLCIAPAENNTPQNIFTENGSEAMAFPSLLPNGQFGLFEPREIKLSPSKYFNCRLFSADSRFSTSKEYLFFAQYLTEINRISSNISLALRKGKQTTEDGRPLTASMLINADHVKDILKSDVGFRFLQPIRGTPPYWQRTMKDLFAMIHQLGIPTWFVTFSSAELRWPEVLDMLLFLKNDSRKSEELEWSEKCSLIADNPLSCARMFDHRVKALFTDLIMSSSCPLGKVQDYFYRTEFQQRGSPHIHCILWIKDAPKIGQNSDQEVCNFIDKYVTCKMPDKETDPELYDIVSTVQIHSKTHSKSCRKYSSTCRFNFPRPPIRKTFIAKPQGDREFNSTKLPSTVEEFDKLMQVASKTPKKILKDIWILVNSAEDTGLSMNDILKLAKISYQQFKQCLIDTATKNTVHIRRDLSDIWVNNYNPDLSRAWNANLDIQYVTDAYACVAYILSYISKAEAEMGDLLQNAQKEALEGNTDASSALRKIGSVYMQNREVSAQEAIYRVCGLHLKQCTRDVTFIPAGSNIFRMSLPMSVIKCRSKQDEDNNDIWMTSIHEKYYNRPQHPDFDNLCLAEFVSKYSILPKSQKPKSTEAQPVFELENNLGMIRKRKPGKEAVVRYPKFKQDKQPDDYFLSMTQLFLPHRTTLKVPPDHVSFEDFVINGIYNGQQVTDVIQNNKRKFEIKTAELEKAWKDVEEGRISEDSWGSLAPEAEVERLESIMEKECDMMDEPEEIPELHCDSKQTSNPSGFHYEPPKVSQREIQDALRSMNKAQQEVFYTIKEWSCKVLRNEKPEAFFLFLTGGAGTGKSHLIRCLYHETNRILSKCADSPDAVSVLLMAPTGTAAFNIQGMTIHSGFAINKKATLPYQPLGENLLNTLRRKFESLKILIIDEVSMVDQKILSYIHGRLTQIMQCKRPFGNVSILAVGDFYQLPPVKGLPLYKRRPADFADLWNENFSIVTLSEVMRQKDDKFFADMLNRLRVHVRGQPLAEEDLLALKHASKDETPVEAKSTLHIYPTNREVNDHNNRLKPCVTQ